MITYLQQFACGLHYRRFYLLIELTAAIKLCSYVLSFLRSRQTEAQAEAEYLICIFTGNPINCNKARRGAIAPRITSMQMAQ